MVSAASEISWRRVTGDGAAIANSGRTSARDATSQVLITHRKTVVEGYKTTKAFASLCAERKIDAPILRQMHAILFEAKKPAAAIAALMTRELKRENLPTEIAGA